jgi:hypothetical protein
MTIYHKHHIIPRHMGGTDDPENLIELTVEEHAEAHRKLYEEHGRWQDYYAWKGLAGLMSNQEVVRAVQSKANSVPKPHLSKLYKERCANGEMKTPTLWGKDNPASKSVICEGQVYDTVSEAGRAYGISKDSIRHRCLSDKPKWKDFSYI